MFAARASADSGGAVTFETAKLDELCPRQVSGRRLLPQPALQIAAKCAKLARQPPCALNVDIGVALLMLRGFVSHGE